MIATNRAGTTPVANRVPGRWALAATAAVWPLVGVLYMRLLSQDQARLGQAAPAFNILVLWLEWGALTPWVIRRALRHSPFGASPSAALRAHLFGLGTAILVLATINNVGRVVLTGRFTDLDASFVAIVVFKLGVAATYGASLYVGTASVVWLIVTHDEARSSQLVVARLTAGVAAEELATLKTRLRPDLTVRVLRTIAALGGSHARGAEDAIHR
ncbi:MAG TPA: hypothetical protein VN605_10715, partial [Thermoanaerobaculia bacterium]|nr:hypothetical protein [Thermoanaerobaculia bacterium]